MAKYKSVSVIIPTFNRTKQLLGCLSSYEKQTLRAEKFEIIIVDDGSRTPVSNYINIKDYKINIRIFRQKNSGPAKARNLGLKKAQNDIILFAGDDIEPATDFLERHLKAHNSYPEYNIAILGYIMWPPEMKMDMVMHYLSWINQPFSYVKIQNRRNAGYEHFYTSNISLKHKYLSDTGEYFCEKFPKAAFEDIEFGYRLEKKYSLRIIFLEDIVGYHKHKMTLSSLYERHFNDGQMVMIFNMLHPEVFKDKISYARGCPMPICKEIPKEFVTIFSKLAEAQNSMRPSFHFKHIFAETMYHFLTRALSFAQHSGIKYALRNSPCLK